MTGARVEVGSAVSIEPGSQPVLTFHCGDRIVSLRAVVRRVAATELGWSSCPGSAVPSRSWPSRCWPPRLDPRPSTQSGPDPPGGELGRWRLGVETEMSAQELPGRSPHLVRVAPVSEKSPSELSG